MSQLRFSGAVWDGQDDQRTFQVFELDMTDNVSTPDSDNEYRDFSGVILKSLVFAFLVATIAIVGFFIWFRPTFTKTDSETRPIVNDFNTLIRDGTPRQMRQFSNELILSLNVQSLPVVIERLGQRVEIADRILELTSDAELREFATTSRLESLMWLHELNLKNNLASDKIRNSLLESATRNLDNENPKIRRKAHLMLSVFRVTEFIADSSTFDSCRERLSTSTEVLAGDLESAKAVAKLVKFVGESKDSEKANMLQRIIADRLHSSPDAEVRQLGASAYDEIIQSKHNFSNLIGDLVLRTANIEPRIERYLTDVETTAGLSSRVYRNVIQLVEALYQQQKTELAQNVLKRIEATIKKISDAEKREAAQKAVAEHLQRRSRLGKPFPITGKDVLGRDIQPADYQDKVTAVLFYSTELQPSLTYLSAFEEFKYLFADGARFVGVSIDKKPKKDIESLAVRYPHIVWIAGESAQAYVNEFPLTHLPYLILVDKHGNLAEINVGLHDLRKTIMAYLEQQ